MGLISYCRQNYREVDAERDRLRLPIWWIMSSLLFAGGLCMFISGAINGLHAFFYAGLGILLSSANGLRVAIKAQRNLKEFDRQKSLAEAS